MSDKQFSLVKVSDIEYTQQLSDSHILYQDLNGHFDMYLQSTQSWATPQQRATDGKYIVPYSELLGDYSQTVETAASSWFTAPSP